MIKGIFLHDLPIYKDKNGRYFSTTLTDNIFKRYINVVDELIVATRVYPLEKNCSKTHQEEITLKNIRFLDIPNLNKPQYIFTRFPKEIKLIKYEMKTCDLVFIRGGIIGLLGAKIAKHLKKQYLAECGGRAWEEYWNYNWLGKIIAPYMEYNAKLTICNASHVIYVTQKYLQGIYPTNAKSESVSDVIIDDTDENVLIERLKKINNKFSNKTWVIGTAGGLNSKIKGQQYVIEAISRLKNKISIRYEIAGSGNPNYLKSLVKKYNVEDKIVFKGEINHQEILNWLDSIDIYIQPSMQEGLPRALVEAMSRACPCIGSTAGGIPELLEPEVIFQRGKVEDLIKIMEKINTINWCLHSKLNFNKSKEFQKNKLDQVRQSFFEDYKMKILKEKI